MVENIKEMIESLTVIQSASDIMRKSIMANSPNLKENIKKFRLLVLAELQPFEQING